MDEMCEEMPWRRSAGLDEGAIMFRLPVLEVYLYGRGERLKGGPKCSTIARARSSRHEMTMSILCSAIVDML